REHRFGFRAPLRTVGGEHLVFVDQTARQLDSQGVVALGIFRDHPELPAADPSGGIDLFHRDLGSGPALDAVAGPLLGQRHHESDDDLVADGVNPDGPRQRGERTNEKRTAEENERSLHRVSSLRKSTLWDRARQVRDWTPPPPSLRQTPAGFTTGR